MSDNNSPGNKQPFDKAKKPFLKRFRWLLIVLAVILLVGVGASAKGIEFYR